MANQRSMRQERRRGPRSGCLNALAALIFVVTLLVLIYAFAVRPMLSRAVADQLAGPTVPVPTLMPVGAPPAAPPPAAPPPAAQAPGQAAEQAVEQAGTLLSDAVAALPPGELVVSDAEINSLIASRPEAIAPLESASIHFTAGVARADVRAFRLSSSVTMGLSAQDGQVVVTNVRVDAPLSLFIAGDEIAARLVGQINAILAAQGRRVDDLRIEEGQLIVVTS